MQTPHKKALSLESNPPKNLFCFVRTVLTGQHCGILPADSPRDMAAEAGETIFPGNGG